MKIWHALDCGLHQSTMRSGACRHCAAFAAKLRDEWAGDKAPHVEKVVHVERGDVDEETLRREYQDYPATAAETVRHAEPRWYGRSKPRRVGNFCHQATEEQRADVVRRVLAGEIVSVIAKEIKFSRAAIYSWLDHARRIERMGKAA